MNKVSLNKFQEKLKEDKGFKICKDNLQEFFECKDMQSILEENNIKYEAKLEDGWYGSYRSRSYHIKLNIFIKENDYERIKKYFENENTSKEDEEEDYLPTKVIKYIKEGFYIFIGILMLVIGVAILRQNIDSIIANIENVISASIIAIIGLIVLIYRIKKYLIKKKKLSI